MIRIFFWEKPASF